jgi:hypothetical protein
MPKDCQKCKAMDKAKKLQDAAKYLSMAMRITSPA